MSDDDNIHKDVTDDLDYADFDDAFAQAQGEMPSAKLNKVNPHFQSRYADIASIKEATQPSLKKYGFSIRQFTRLSPDGTKVILVTRLARKGIREEGEYPIALDRPQAMGSSLTYGRRYNWALATGVSFEEDDDANEAEREKPPAKTKATARLEKNYEALVSLLGEAQTRAEVMAFITSYRDQIEELPDDWKDTFRMECKRYKEGLAE